MAPSPRYLDEARAIVERELAGVAADVYLFGSWARGDPRRISDIDIAVLPRDPTPAVLLSRLREAFEESSIPYPVDVVDLREASPSLRDLVLREGIRWSA